MPVASRPTTGDLQERLGGIIATAMDAIVTIDASQRIVLFNDAAARMFRLPAAQALGQPLDRLIPMRHRADHHEHVQRYRQSDGVARPMKALRALHGLRSDGQEFPVEATISRLGSGDDALMTVMVRDVTEVREAERSRQEQAARRAANQAKTEFLSRMSHDMRTPLNAVLGMSHLLQDGLCDRLTEREARQFGMLHAAGQQLRLLIDGVLDLARLDSGELEIEARDVDLAAVIDEAVNVNAASAITQDVQLVVGCEFEQPMIVRTDPVRLRQALSNLVASAIERHRPGGQLLIQARRDGLCARISMLNHGPGSTAALQAERNSAHSAPSDDTCDSGGLGLGLGLTRKLLSLLGACLRVEDSTERGLAIHVGIPVGGAAPASPSGTVLYIEDNPVNALLVTEMLGRWPDVHVVVAESGGAGLEQARLLKPALVLLDMRLPDMTGLQVLQQLKSDPATCNLVVVALSANGLTDDVDTAMQAGARDYWTKPIEFANFLDKVRGLLARCAD